MASSYWSSAPQSFRHPWFSGVSPKRKHSGSDSDDDTPVHIHWNDRSLNSTFREGQSNARDENANANADSSEIGGYGYRHTSTATSSHDGTGANAPRGRSEHGQHVRKRRRCEEIERRMAHMRLAPGQENEGRIDGGVAVGARADGGYTHTWSSNGMSRDAAAARPASSTSVPIHRGSNKTRPVSFMVPPPITPSSSSSSASSLYAYTISSTSPIEQTDLLSEYVIEEPGSPALDYNNTISPVVDEVEAISIGDVRMRGAEPAWYEREKDRIVITDLEEVYAELEEEEEAARAAEAAASTPTNNASSTTTKSESGTDSLMDGDEYKNEAEPHPDASDYADTNADYSISALLLDHIKRQTKSNLTYGKAPPLLHQTQQAGTVSSQALILYRPPPVLLPTSASAPGTAEEKDEDDRKTLEAKAKDALRKRREEEEKVDVSMDVNGKAGDEINVDENGHEQHVDKIDVDVDVSGAPYSQFMTLPARGNLANVPVVKMMQDLDDPMSVDMDVD